MAEEDRQAPLAMDFRVCYPKRRIEGISKEWAPGGVHSFFLPRNVSTMSASPPDTTPLTTATSGRASWSPSRHFEALLDPILSSLGYELVLVDWTASGRHRKMIVYADRPEGFTLDDCSRLSPILSAALDAAELDPQTPEFGELLGPPYVLEVSSPGLDRPLSRRGHYAQFLGHKATIRTSVSLTPESSQKVFHGQIVGVEPDANDPADDHRGTISLQAEDGPIHKISLGLVRRANLVYED